MVMTPRMDEGMEMAGEYPVGRDPRRMTTDELRALGHERKSPLRALRERCLDCCAGRAQEVRLCTGTKCPAWPFRMGGNPWREVTDQQRENGRRLSARTGGGARLEGPASSSDAHGS